MVTSQEVEAKLKQMLLHAIHFGHKTAQWNPKMSQYIYGQKHGVHIIDIRESFKGLEKAKEFLSKKASEGKIILLVSTKAQVTMLIKETAERCNMPYVVQKWIGGLLTNFSTVKKRTTYLKKLKQEEQSGGFEKYTKKEALKLKKTIEKLDNALGGVSALDNLPDVLFVADALKDKIAVAEAHKLKIPIVGIVDSNADPSKIDFPIPGNDDALRSLGYILGEIEKTIIDGKNEKKVGQEKQRTSKKEIITS